MRLRWITLATLLVALDAYLLLYRWGDVAGNVEAQFIIATPQFIALHLLSKRRADHHQAEVHARLDAQDEALAASHATVTELQQRLAE